MASGLVGSPHLGIPQEELEEVLPSQLPPAPPGGSQGVLKTAWVYPGGSSSWTYLEVPKLSQLAPFDTEKPLQDVQALHLSLRVSPDTLWRKLISADLVLSVSNRSS